jgi:hypothetical protein
MKAMAAVMVSGQAAAGCGSDHPAHDAHDAQGGAAYICNAWGYCIYRAFDSARRSTPSTHTRRQRDDGGEGGGAVAMLVPGPAAVARASATAVRDRERRRRQCYPRNLGPNSSISARRIIPASSRTPGFDEIARW